MNYDKIAWFEAVDTALKNQIETKHTTSKGKTRLIKMNAATAFLAYHIAQKFADWTTGEGVWCSHQKLSTQYHMSTRTVAEAFILLTAFGFMQRDHSREEVGGTNYYDLKMPDPSFLETGGLFPTNKGSFPGNEGVVSEKQQTTNRTTNLTTKESTKGASEAHATATPLEPSYLTNKIDSLLSDKEVDEEKENEEEQGGSFQETRVGSFIERQLAKSVANGRGSTDAISTSTVLNEEAQGLDDEWLSTRIRGNEKKVVDVGAGW